MRLILLLGSNKSNWFSLKAITRFSGNGAIIQLNSPKNQTSDGNLLRRGFGKFDVSANHQKTLKTPIKFKEYREMILTKGDLNKCQYCTWVHITDARESMLQLQCKGHEGNLFRHRQNGYSGQIGGWIPSIPFTGGCLESQTMSCRREETFGYCLVFMKTIHFDPSPNLS